MIIDNRKNIDKKGERDSKSSKISELGKYLNDLEGNWRHIRIFLYDQGDKGLPGPFGLKGKF
jgi:hypothetical protein